MPATIPVVRIITARRIITRADREPIEHGALRVAADGTIDAVGRAADFPFVDTDLGDVTLIPGMIDAHVHLSSDCSPAMGWLPGEEHPEASAVLRIVANAHAFLRAGVDTIEHATFSARPRATVDEALVAEIAAAGRYVIPTVNNYWLTVGVPWAPADLALANLRRLYDLGIPLVAGTDMGLNTTTPELYAEGLMVFAEIGMDPRDILASATHRAADAIGLADQAGEITAGRTADLVGLDGDPLTDPSAYRRVRFVMRGGQHCL